MLGLLPVENWEYNLSDIIRGFAATQSPIGQNRILYIKGLGNCFPVSSGRAAIVIALKALALKPGARIGVPLYCCNVVLKAIDAAGCTPVFIDVDPRTFCVSTEDLFTKRFQIDALIAAHMFGNLCDMTKLQEIMDGKPVIEDCAQSLGSMLNDSMAGSFSIISIFSFRSGKYLSAGEGGALFSNNQGICDRVSELIGSVHVPKISNEYVHILKTYLRSKLRSRPLYGLIGYPLWQFYNKKVVGSSEQNSNIVPKQIYRSDLAIAIHRLKFIDSTIKKQRANSDYYSHYLKLDSDMLCSEKPGTFYNRYLYPITFRSKIQRDLVADYLHRHQIGTIKPYQDIVDIAVNKYSYAGDCPVAEKLLKKVLIIPNHHELKRRDLSRIAQCLNKGWEEIRTASS